MEVAIVLVIVALVSGGGIVTAFVVAGRRRTRDLIARRTAALELEGAAGRALVQMDDRIRLAEDELGFAIAQVGESDAAGLSTAIRDARAKLREAFELKQQLDDHIPDSEQDRANWSMRILDLCGAAGRGLDEQASAIAALRAQRAAAPRQLARLQARASSSRARLAGTSAVMDALRFAYDPVALRAIELNPSQAEQLLGVVDRSLQLAADRLHGGERADVTSQLRAAEQAIERVDRLIDAVDRYETELLEAESTIPVLVEECQDDIREARRLLAGRVAPQPRADLETALAAAESTLAAVPASGRPDDPLGLLGRLRDADAALDLAILEVEQHEQRARAAAGRLATAVDEAQHRIAIAKQVIDGYRGPVGSDARTRLVEAERVLDEATDERDPEVALPQARRAAGLAQAAAELARADIDRAMAPQYAQYSPRYPQGRRGRAGSDIASGILGGIVVGGLLDNLFD